MTGPTLTTERLRAWIIEASPDGDTHQPRDLVIACVTDYDWPAIAVSAAIWPGYGHLVEWLQVADPMRGMGYGQELLEALERHYRCSLSMTATTDAGAALMRRMGRDGS